MIRIFFSFLTSNALSFPYRQLYPKVMLSHPSLERASHNIYDGPNRNVSQVNADHTYEECRKAMSRICRRRYLSISEKIEASKSKDIQYADLLNKTWTLKKNSNKVSSDKNISRAKVRFETTETLSNVLESMNRHSSNKSIDMEIALTSGYMTGCAVDGGKKSQNRSEEKDEVEEYIAKESQRYREAKLYTDIEFKIMDMVAMIERIGSNSNDWRHSVIFYTPAERMNLIYTSALELDTLNNSKNKKHRQSAPQKSRDGFHKPKSQSDIKTSKSYQKNETIQIQSLLKKQESIKKRFTNSLRRKHQKKKIQDNLQKQLELKNSDITPIKKDFHQIQQQTNTKMKDLINEETKIKTPEKNITISEEIKSEKETAFQEEKVVLIGRVKPAHICHYYSKVSKPVTTYSHQDNESCSIKRSPFDDQPVSSMSSSSIISTSSIDSGVHIEDSIEKQQHQSHYLDRAISATTDQKLQSKVSLSPIESGWNQHNKTKSSLEVCIEDSTNILKQQHLEKNRTQTKGTTKAVTALPTTTTALSTTIIEVHSKHEEMDEDMVPSQREHHYDHNDMAKLLRLSQSILDSTLEASFKQFANDSGDCDSDVKQTDI